MRPQLARTLADSALRIADRQLDAMTAGTPLEPPAEPEVPIPHSNPEPQ